MIISAQNKCSSLVCSCYVPARNSSDIKLEEEEEEEEESNNSTSKNQSFAENYNNGSSQLMEEQEIKNSSNCQEKIIKNGWSHNIEQQQPTPIKSNLKRSTRTTTITTTTVVMEDNEQKRKVSWPDAHGKDIALVHEFEASLSEDEELEGVRNSCVCTIQ